MRYALILIFGGIYIDADNQKWGGDLHGFLSEIPAYGIAAGIDPHVFASTPKHPVGSYIHKTFVFYVYSV